MKHHILLFLLTLTQISLMAQTRITGQVTDANGEGLTGANIYLEGTYDGTTSNLEGKFILESSETGEQVLNIEFIGFKGFQLTMVLEGRTIDLSQITLKEELNELTAVTITAGTFEAGDKKKSIALSSIDMVTTDGSSGDVYGALQALPGTTTVGESGRLFVKGGDSRESKTFIDGTLVYVPYSSSSPNTSVRGRFSPFMFSGMMFSTGGYSAEFGQALSSVLSLQTNAMPVEDQLNISLLTVGAELGGIKSWDKASVSTALSYYNLTPYMKVVPQYTTWDKEPQSLAGDLSFRLKTGKSGLLKFYTTINRSRLTSIEENLNHPGSTIRYNLVNDNYFLNASWIGEIREDWILSTGFSYANNMDKMAIDSMKINEALQGTHAKLTLKHRISDRIKILAGTEWYYKSYGMEFPGAETSSQTNYVNNTLTGFIESELYASSRFITRAGVRFEYSDYLKRSSLAPRISTACKLGKTGQVSLAYGWFFQDPDDEYLLYTPELEFERADHITLNFLYNKDQKMLRTELYFKNYKNLVKYGWSEEQEYSFINNTGDGYAYGLDLFWRDKKSIKNGEYWISYSYIESLRDYLDYPEQAIPNFSSKHNLSLVYKHWIEGLRSMLGSSYHYSSPRYYNNPNSQEFNGELTKAYHSLNMNWSLLLKQNVILYFTVSNILGYDQQYGQSYVSSPGPDGIYNSKPILPGAKRWFLVGCFITLSKDKSINQLDKIN
ncbi:MAG: TonB-dependent receptor [Bacteroidota bacterium]|nr:TonB-dependent receptor [Bacteroidota bacterium]